MEESKLLRYLDTKYFISSDGYILNSKTGKMIKPQDNGKGYQKVTLTHHGKQIQRYIHRLVAESFIPLKNSKTQVNHIDGNKLNNYVSNLEWCTNQENQIHAHKIGLKKSGNSLWNGKFSKSDLIKIRLLDEKGEKRFLIAAEMNCSKSTISDILNGKRYLLGTN